MSIFRELYAAPFRLISAVVDIFVSNRNRIRDFLSIPRVANTLKYGMVLTMLIWLAIAMLAKEEDKKRLNDAVRGFWPEIEDNSHSDLKGG
jgi:hypothetical protein